MDSMSDGIVWYDIILYDTSYFTSATLIYDEMVNDMYDAKCNDYKLSDINLCTKPYLASHDHASSDAVL